MTLTLTLALSHDVYMPGEPVRAELTFVNAGSAPLTVAVPGSASMPEARFILGGGSYAGRIAPPLVPLGDVLEMDPGDEVSAWLEVPAEPTRATGEHRVYVEIDLPSGTVRSTEIGFRRDVMTRAQIVVPRRRGDDNARGWPCFHLLRGEHVAALYRASLGWNDDWPAKAMEAAIQERIATLPPRISPILTASGPARLDWIAWASLGEHGPVLHAAKVGAGFDAGSIEIGEGLSRIVRDVLPTANGGCDVAILTKALDRMELHRFDHDETARSAVARRVWSASLPRSTPIVAVARGSGEHQDRTAVALALATPDGVELHYGVATSVDPPRHFGTVIVPDVLLVADTTIALAMDRRGNGHVALVATRADSPGIVLARIAFDGHGRPRLDHSTIAHDVAELPAPAVASAASFFIDDLTSRWSIDWAVLLADGRCLVSGRHDDQRVIAPECPPCVPLELISFRSRALLAAHDLAGNRRFIDCS